MLKTKKTSLKSMNIHTNDRVVIDPDNTFWAVIRGQNNSKISVPEKVLQLYKNKKNTLDREMHNFRFDAKLTAIYIDPTDRCNANCPYCYIPTEIRKNGRQMSQKELFYILNKIAKYFSPLKRKAVIVFHASEPLLVKDMIFEAIEKFAGQFNFGLQTNAILLKKEDVQFLKKHRVGIGISLDSPDPKTNNFLRRTAGLNGNFDKAVRAIKWFNGYEGLNVITTITKYNLTHLPDIVKFLHRKKVPCVLINPVRLTQKSSHRLKPNEKLMSRYFIKAVDKAMALSKSTGHRIIIGNFTNVILGIIAPTARRLMCDISPCGGGRCFLTITASGNMVPCGEFIGINGFSGGNIFSAPSKKDPIGEAMQSVPFKKIRSRIVEKISDCKTCIFRNICGAPCPAELHSLGNMYKKSIFCNFYKEIIEYAFKLIAQGKEKYSFRQSGLNNLEYEYRLR